MVEIYSVGGKWKQNEKLQWVFLVDTAKGGSLCEVDEYISYKGLVESVIEDFGLESLVKDISLSYELPQRMKLMLEDSLPIHIRNDRQVCTFIKKKQGDPEIIRLCVTELHRSTGSDISKPHPLVGTSSISAAHENQKEPHPSVGTSFISAAHENQKEPHPSVGTSSISVPYSDTCSTAEKGRGNKSLDLLHAPDRSPIPIGGVHSTRGADDIYVNNYFINKAELMQKMRTWALEYKFEFRCLLSIIPDAADLVFVSDRAPTITKALSELYPLSHHGICTYHLGNNIKQNLAAYLEEADLRKWARCFAPSHRYNIMTTNIAESLNSVLKEPRELPVLSLLETIRLTLTTWFHERREKAAKHNKRLTPIVTKEMVLRDKNCTCCVDIDKIPCIHAIAASKRTNMDENKLADDFNLTDTWAKAYAESIHPSGDAKNWVFPDSIMVFLCTSRN
ncbi:unnamed protein product [Arabidopsis arenosa]|uniref:SWIM-type domain-containing protein n=1 Tax=Arabidopsis arenosa TaxID=38785 RepID=A0A8S1ZWK1_ARAAE|nr:unnamed protein product [Arabidopsis arenosa]